VAKCDRPHGAGGPGHVATCRELPELRRAAVRTLSIASPISHRADLRKDSIVSDETLDRVTAAIGRRPPPFKQPFAAVDTIPGKIGSARPTSRLETDGDMSQGPVKAPVHSGRDVSWPEGERREAAQWEDFVKGIHYLPATLVQAALAGKLRTAPPSAARCQRLKSVGICKRWWRPAIRLSNHVLRHVG
jgi:hypothetical protein